MRILYVTTTFPVYSETFLQREARALLKADVEVRIVSLHRGEGSFEGHRVERFSKGSLLKLVWALPLAALRSPSIFSGIVREMLSRRPGSVLNLLENLLGFGAAVADARGAAAFRPDLIHCVWASAPAAYGMLLSSLIRVPFSTGAHAYDIFEYGGDWLLKEKTRRAAFVHVSTDVAADRIRRICRPDKVKRIRRGLNELPRCSGLRSNRRRLRIVCVARLVEKKGLFLQLEIYRSLRAAGVEFEARIVGDGPLAGAIGREIQSLGLSKQVILLGRLTSQETLEHLQWADALFHTGIVAASGDRDGLPNVVPEAMACGALVVASPISGVVEAISDGITGFLRSPYEPDGWVEACRIVQSDETRCTEILERARRWVEAEFDADRNTGDLIRCMKERGDSTGF